MTRVPPSERTLYKDLEVGHPALKRESFRSLIQLLFNLKVTDYICIPTVSDPYHLIKGAEYRVYLTARPVMASPMKHKGVLKRVT